MVGNVLVIDGALVMLRSMSRSLQEARAFTCTHMSSLADMPLLSVTVSCTLHSPAVVDHW